MAAAGDYPPGEIVTAGSFEQMRQHITEQLARIADENELRARGLQDEIDRRFAAEQNMRDALKTLLDERAENARESYRMIQEEIDRRFTEAARAVRVALEGAEKAVAKAETANERRLDSVNEFRGQLTDQTATFMTRNEFTAQHSALLDVVTQLRQDLTRVDGTVVPRNENEAWRAQIAEKLSDNTKALTDRIGALELRLTSRLDLGAGHDSGERDYRSEIRDVETLAASLKQAAAASPFRANLAAAFSGLAVLVSAIVLAVSLATGHL